MSGANEENSCSSGLRTLAEMCATHMNYLPPQPYEEAPPSHDAMTAVVSVTQVKTVCVF